MHKNEKYQEIMISSHIEKKGKFKGDIVSKLLYKITKKYISDTVLDVGAGSGALLRLLEQEGYKVEGVDLYPISPRIKRGTISKLDFEPDKFKTVFCNEILEHLTTGELEAGINEVYRVLREKGKVIITTPFQENIEKGSYICPECGHKFHKHGHILSFDERNMTDILRKKGFKIIFAKVYAFGAMVKIPFGCYLNFIFKKMDFDFIGKTLVVVAEK